MLSACVSVTMQLAFSRERISHEQLYWFNAKSTVSSRTAYLFFVTSLGFNLSCLHLYHVTHHNLTSPAANLLTPAVARITAQQMAIRAKTPPLRVLLDNIPSLVIRANAPERRQRFQNSTSSNRPGILPGISKFHGKKIFLIKSNISIIDSKLVASAAPPSPVHCTIDRFSREDFFHTTSPTIRRDRDDVYRVLTVRTKRKTDR